MKKINLFISSFFFTVLGSAQVVNGGFESYSSLPTCPTNTASNTCITHVQTWNGLHSTYGTSCTYSDANNCSSGVEYYNSAPGGTGSCVLIGANSGTGFVYLDGQGFYPSATGRNEYVYEQLSGSLTGGTTYLVTAYINTLNTSATCAAWLVPTSVGAGAASILNNLRGQNPQPVAQVGNGNNWIQVTMKVIPPSNGTYYLVLGNSVICNDGANSILWKLLIDDVAMSVAPACTANAGPDKGNTTPCCPGNPCSSVTIGTASIAGYTYVWSPTSDLSNPYIAQPSATPCNTVTPTTYVVTVSGPNCADATDAVVVTTSQYHGASCCRIGNFSNQPITSFNVYPNPTKDKFIVTLYAAADYIKVMNATGKVVYEVDNITESEVQVDLSKHGKGIYFVTAKIGEKLEKQKVVIE